ncbi:MAG: hypothetical protein IIB60_06165 [Planctomycetes bacterium]|nr:hypothetical protein [Planctomycetota bacterium]
MSDTRRGPAVWTTTLIALCLSSCTGSATIHIVKLGTKGISAQSPLILEINPNECYYWLDDDGNLCVAMRSHKPSVLGTRFEQEFQLSLVLEAPPAGAARNYRVTRRTLRFRRDAGYTHTRGASLVGIVGVWDFGPDKLSGRFRITALRQSYWVPTGWRTNARVLLLGDFTAFRDPVKGQAILDRTEEGNIARPTPRNKPKK